jgi:tetratricopeptide (TPR) repeat protein
MARNVRSKPAGYRTVMGTQYLGIAGLDDELDIQERTRKMLSRALNTGQTVCVAGSGLSANYGFKLWRELAADVIEDAKNAGRRDLDAHTERYFDLLGSRLRNPKETVSAEEIMVAFDVCAHEWGDKSTFKAHVAGKLQGAPPPGDHDPLRLIIRELRIRRFLTTNYDNTIAKKLKDYSDGGPSYTIGESGHLLEFAVGTPGHRSGVFHLHGHMGESENLIISESDYQQLYLREDPAARTYREALSLLFTGNPLLFVGMGLTEFDLLHPLRESAAQPRRDVDQAPLFALMPRPDEPGAAVGQRRQIYTRYGIHVLFYPPLEEGDWDDVPTGEIPKNFEDALGTLATRRIEWWEEWRRKPPLQVPRFVREGPEEKWMLLNPARSSEGGRDKFFNLTADFEKIGDALEARKDVGCLVFAIGRAGMGKGGIGNQLVREFENDRYDRRFFATLHFTNDFMSIIEAAARHLDPGGDNRESSMDRLERALARERHLLVLGAVERVLEPIITERDDADNSGFDGATAHAAEGRASGDIATFLRLAARIAARPGGSHIVLTSALVPRWDAPCPDISEAAVESQTQPAAPPETDMHAGGTPDGSVPEAPTGGGCVPILLEGVSKGEAAEQFKRLITVEDTEHLTRMLGRHAYLMWLIRRALSKLNAADDDRDTWIRRLFHRLSSVDRDRRRHEALEAVIEVHVDKSRFERRGVVDVLQSVALFTTPVSAQTVVDALVDSDDAKRAEKALDVTAQLRELADVDLVLQVETNEGIAYTAHTALRSYFLGKLGLSDMPGETHKFTLAGYSGEVPVTQPGTLFAHDLAARRVDALLGQAESSEREPIERLQALRAAFGIARARWSATGIARLGADTLDVTGLIENTHYGSYMKRLSRLANAARSVGGDAGWLHWDENEEIEAAVEDGGALFVDELAWLYNELGLASFLRGVMPDAQALFRMGRGINELVERSLPYDEKRGHRWAESHLNLAIVATDRGHLERASNHLGVALREIASWPGGGHPDLAARLKGHLALVHHLTGDYAQAGTYYEEAIQASTEIGNRRAVSLFSKHHADLYRVLRKLPQAREKIRESVAAAESARHYDVLQYARVAEAHLDYTEHGLENPVQDFDHAIASAGAASTITTLLEVERYARRAGLAKLEQETLRVHARVVLRQGDVDRATKLTLRCLSIASLNGLGLSLTRSLVLMAQVLIERGETDRARRLLRSTAELAESQRYQLQAEAAERELLKLGIEDKAPNPRSGGRNGYGANDRAKQLV